MNNNNLKSNILFGIALICVIWFMLTSWFWTFGINVIISFPFGIISYFLWRRGKKQGEWVTGYKAISIMLLLGVLSAVGTMVALLLYN